MKKTQKQKKNLGVVVFLPHLLSIFVAAYLHAKLDQTPELYIPSTINTCKKILNIALSFWQIEISLSSKILKF